mmetsp:Transcript_104566/g.156600  ORF Transcript_104566/g.156600 Transcript_104566/m.156600 type:complete len:564 (+) Transcript_104566:150-1841(+)
MRHSLSGGTRRNKLDDVILRGLVLGSTQVELVDLLRLGLVGAVLPHNNGVVLLGHGDEAELLLLQVGRLRGVNHRLHARDRDAQERIEPRCVDTDVDRPGGARCLWALVQEALDRLLLVAVVGAARQVGLPPEGDEEVGSGSLVPQLPVSGLVPLPAVRLDRVELAAAVSALGRDQRRRARVDVVGHHVRRALRDRRAFVAIDLALADHVELLLDPRQARVVALLLLRRVVVHDAVVLGDHVRPQAALGALDTLAARYRHAGGVGADHAACEHHAALLGVEVLPLLAEEHLLLDTQVVRALARLLHDVELRRREPRRRLLLALLALDHALRRHLREEALSHLGRQRVDLRKVALLVRVRPLLRRQAVSRRQHRRADLLPDVGRARALLLPLRRALLDAVVPGEAVLGVGERRARGPLDPPQRRRRDRVPVVVGVVVEVGEEPRHAQPGAPAARGLEVQVHVEVVGERSAPASLEAIRLGARAGLEVIEPHIERGVPDLHLGRHVQPLDLAVVVVLAHLPHVSVDRDLLHPPLRLEDEVPVLGDHSRTNVAAHIRVRAGHLLVL